MRLIDADELLITLRMSCKWHAQNSRELSLLQRDINIVKEQPTVDAIPISWINEWYDRYNYAEVGDLLNDWVSERKEE